MDGQQGSPAGRRVEGVVNKRINKEAADKAREKFKGMLKPNQGLKDLEPDELMVLIADAAREASERGGSNVLPRGIERRLSRMIG